MLIGLVGLELPVRRNVR